jgi:hypothetical protein
MKMIRLKYNRKTELRYKNRMMATRSTGPENNVNISMFNK